MTNIFGLRSLLHPLLGTLLHPLLGAAVCLVLAAPAVPSMHAQATGPKPLADLPAQFVTLGTGGGPVIQTMRSRPANAVVVGDAVYLFDVGNGVLRQMALAKLPLLKLRAVFLSHSHVDHNADLAPVLLTRWLLYNTLPLPVIGPKGTTEMTADLARAYRSVELAPLTGGDAYRKPPIAASIAARDLPQDTDKPVVVFADDRIRVLAFTDNHFHYPAGSEEARFERSYAFRIETARRVFVFTGDTGVSPHVAELARGADVLVSEVIDLPAIAASLRARPEMAAQFDRYMAHMRQDHLTPAQVGDIAADAGVKEVVLTHLSPGLDGEKDTSGYTNGIDARYKGPVKVAKDLDRW